jgi:hypothetical protein
LKIFTDFGNLSDLEDLADQDDNIGEINIGLGDDESATIELLSNVCMEVEDLAPIPPQTQTQKRKRNTTRKI